MPDNTPAARAHMAEESIGSRIWTIFKEELRWVVETIWPTLARLLILLVIFGGLAYAGYVVLDWVSMTLPIYSLTTQQVYNICWTILGGVILIGIINHNRKKRGGGHDHHH